MNLKVRTVWKDGKFDLYLGEIFLGIFDQLTVTPLANAISEATRIQDEEVELRRALAELSQVMGNPAVIANGAQTLESELVREAVRRLTKP